MRIHIEAFVTLPKWQLYFFGPTLQKIEDICLLTHSDVNKIRHHVRGSDNNIYDAFALHTWLNTQHDNKFVIPGKYINYVETTSWFWWSCFRLYTCNPFNTFNKVDFRSTFRNLAHAHSETQTHAIKQTHAKITYNTKVNLNRVIKTIVKHKYTIKKKGNFSHSCNSSFQQI
tara:strand:- start:676 stop:1191 length:516 start_codon:yes stop_codon:yes gene_type:complete